MSPKVSAIIVAAGDKILLKSLLRQAQDRLFYKGGQTFWLRINKIQGNVIDSL